MVIYDKINQPSGIPEQFPVSSSVAMAAVTITGAQVEDVAIIAGW